MKPGFSLNIPIFILGFAIGILYVYLLKPGYTKIIRYPTPETCGKIVYRDNSENCFIYEYEKVVCGEKSQMQPLNL